MALEIWLPTAMSKFTSAGENSRGVRLPTTKPPMTRSLDHRTTTYAARSSSLAWMSRKICGSAKPCTERNVACTALMCCISSGFTGTGGKCRAYFAVLTAHFEFEVGDLALLLQEPLKPFAIRALGIERRGNIYSQQLLAVLIAGHSKKRIVEIQEAPLGSGDKHAFLNAGYQRTVF